MPTTLRSPSTTGIAPRSVLASRSIAARASPAGVTDGTSASMISAAVFTGARLIDPTAAKQANRERGDDVGGDHRLGGAEAVRGLAAGAGVGENAGAGGGEGLEPTGQERGDDAGEDVAAAGGG